MADAARAAMPKQLAAVCEHVLAVHAFFNALHPHRAVALTRIAVEAHVRQRFARGGLELAHVVGESTTTQTIAVPPGLLTKDVRGAILDAVEAERRSGQEGA